MAGQEEAGKLVCVLRKVGDVEGIMADNNLNIWGLLAMPAGVAICFGTALVVWLWKEIHAGPEDEEKGG